MNPESLQVQSAAGRLLRHAAGLIPYHNENLNCGFPIAAVESDLAAHSLMPIERMHMELATPDLLQIVLNSHQPTRRRVQRRNNIALSTPELADAQRRLQSPRCHCGACRTCMDNARWEKIFQEKFADPAYYGFRAPSPTSSLSR